MGVPNHFELTGVRGFFRPAGSVSLDEATDIITAALAFAYERGACEMLVDVSALTGFPAPCLGDRYFFVAKWAAVAAGRLCLAVVAPLEQIDPKKFGVTVASNRGLECDVFPTEAEALAWLDRRAEARALPGR